jgi:hypothetical protein
MDDLMMSLVYVYLLEIEFNVGWSYWCFGLIWQLLIPMGLM